ncbi:MAG: hypothetical protein ACK4V6_03830 [Microthrixaceae bacterium]
MNISSRRFVSSVAAAALLAAGVLVSASGTAAAAPTQTQCGNTAANPSISVDRSTVGVDETAVVTVTGRSYLLPPHVCGTDVFGGIYLFFGWAQPGGQWGPSFKSSTSTQGLFGTTYSYPGQGGGAETRDDGTGTVRLISFTAGGESGTSTPFHMDGQGSWRADLTVRGSTYSFTDIRTGASQSVDCTVVQCGVFTIGAHGKASRTNERFVPINFTDASGAPIVPSSPNGAGAGGVSDPAVAPGGVGGAAGAGSATGSGSIGSGSGAGASTTVAPTKVGSVGDAPTTTSSVEDSTEEGDEDIDAEVLDAEQTAAVQDFGDDGGGGGSGLLIGGAALLVAVAVVGGVLVARRRRGTAPVAS